MKHISVMIKPASSMCDSRCGYCFYSDVSKNREIPFLGLMSKETAESIILNIYKSLLAGDSITFGFQGGEPCLRGLDFFEFFVDTAKSNLPYGVNINYVIQTNGLAIDEKWCNFFKKNRFLVGLSLDGDSALHNNNRKDAYGKGTYNRVMNTKKLFDTYKIRYNILCVLTSEIARRGKKIWDFILKENIRYIQFIPCLEPLNDTAGDIHLTPERFYRFYSDLFPLWQKKTSVRVRLFDDLLIIASKNKGAACGMTGRCSPQFIIESDGSVYPCDFYVLDKYKACNLTEVTLKEAFDSLINGSFFESNIIPGRCNTCIYKSWCNGGCKRMKNAVYGDICGMSLFLNEYGGYFFNI